MTYFDRPGVGRSICASATPLLLLAVLLAACSGDSGGGAAAGGKLRVVATTVQITALTKEVAGDKIQLTGLVPAGADPHSFEPKPSDLAAIENADLILRHGMGLDEWLDDTLRAGNDATVLTMTGGIPAAEGEGLADPHVWHDPDKASIMVDNINRALDAADPDNRP